MECITQPAKLRSWFVTLTTMHPRLKCNNTAPTFLKIHLLVIQTSLIFTYPVKIVNYKTTIYYVNEGYFQSVSFYLSPFLQFYFSLLLSLFPVPSLFSLSPLSFAVKRCHLSLSCATSFQFSIEVLLLSLLIPANRLCRHWSNPSESQRHGQRDQLWD